MQRPDSRSRLARHRAEVLCSVLLAGAALLALSAPAHAQTFPLRPARRAVKLAVFHGYVQVFSHAAVTVRGPKNRAQLRTFTYAAPLRQKLQNRHLVYGEKIAVYYQPAHQLAVRLKAKTYPGS